MRFVTLVLTCVTKRRPYQSGEPHARIFSSILTRILVLHALKVETNRFSDYLPLYQSGEATLGSDEYYSTTSTPYIYLSPTLI
eukprot:COSAG05_NODE_676_length_7987_cov_3.066041_5_plen_83_part_00